MSAPGGDLIGRAADLDELEQLAVVGRARLIVVSGPSGIGKTRLVETFAYSPAAGAVFPNALIRTVYRLRWEAALGLLKRSMNVVAPANATREELEDALIESASATNLMLVIDNVDIYNARDVAAFGERWLSRAPSAVLILTVQPDVRSALPANWTTVRVGGISEPDDVTVLLGDLTATLPAYELQVASDRLGGNPQLLLFLRWIAPKTTAELRETVTKLSTERMEQAVEDLVDSVNLSSLFFLALGVHKDLNVDERLLASLWDHYGSRGAAPFVRALETLVSRQFLSPTSSGSFRLHESVHANLQKVLIDRVGVSRIPSLHSYFAEYYRQRLQEDLSSTSLSHYVYHGCLAGAQSSMIRTLVGSGVAARIAQSGSTLQVRSELETLKKSIVEPIPDTEQNVELDLMIAQLSNALSDHRSALALMNECTAVLPSISDEDVRNQLLRRIWYTSAVGYSNTGQSDLCLRNYFRIVASSSSDGDELACLSLGYLCHDLKYRDIETAKELGTVALRWSRTLHLNGLIAKNLCSYAETLSFSGNHESAREHFFDAETWANSVNDRREIGRILINRGFASVLEEGSDGADDLIRGTEVSRQLGDRRRSLQGTLYQGLRLLGIGARIEGRALVREAAQGFRLLGDGRYFAPSILALRVIDGPLYGQEEEVTLLEQHWSAHAEFRVYARFWEPVLASLLR